MGNGTCFIVCPSENLSPEKTEEMLGELDETLLAQCQAGVPKVGNKFIPAPDHDGCFEVWVFSPGKLLNAKTIITNYGFIIIPKEKP